MDPDPDPRTIRNLSRIQIQENYPDPDPQPCLEQYQMKKLSSNIPNAALNHEKTNNQSTTQI
jgi:hypothetical protein